MKPFSGMFKIMVPDVKAINLPGFNLMKTDHIGWIRAFRGAVSIRWTGEGVYFETKYLRVLTKKTADDTLEIAITIGAKSC